MRINITFIGNLFYAVCLLITISAADALAATFVVTNTGNSGAGSLRQAVLDSNAAAGLDIIVFDPSVFGSPQTITLTSVITINPATGDSLTITGPGANLLTISGNNVVGIFSISASDTASISGMTLSQGSTNGVGGAISNSGNLTATGLVITSNQNNNGGAAVTNSGTAVFTNCSFSQNTTSGEGGAISNSGNLTVTNSAFNSNTGSYGGAIANSLSLTVNGSTFTNNTATSGSATGLGGGAIYSSTFTPTAVIITNSTFHANAEIGGSGGGGAVSNRSGTMNITNSIFTNNSAVDGGGAISNRGILSISGSTLTGNRATGPNNQQSGQGSGGAILIQGAGQITINDSIISGNSAPNHGGGIYYQPNSTPTSFTITNSTVSNNISNTDGATGSDSGHGGGIYATELATITGTTISGNTAMRGTTDNSSGNGGGIYALRKINMNNSTVSGNVAEWQGGGIYDAYPGGGNSEVVITNSTIVENRATNIGGGIRGTTSVGDTFPTLGNTILANNLGADFSGTIISQGYNLIENPAGAIITGNSTGNIIGVDPLLGPLRFNGGPTRTHALLPLSPAIDTGNPSAFPETDQRGIARPQDGNGDGSVRADIGAYERRFADIARQSVSDFDGDGKTDLVVFRPSDRVWYLNRSSQGFTGVQFGISTDRLAPADYDGDGRADISVYRDGIWYRLNSSNNSFHAVQFGIASDIPTAGDYDGDGKADISVWRPSDGVWYRLNSSNGQFVAQQFGSNGDIPVNGDFNGDGRRDLAVFRPANGTWYIARPSGTPSQNFDAVVFGTNGDIPVASDYDGDGKDDVAVYRPNGGLWFRLNSSNGQFHAIQFGISTDVPVPGDYDGDGRADQAVYRNGVWYINQSTSGFTATQFGIAEDKPAAFAYLR